MRRTKVPESSAFRSGSQSLPQTILMTWQPAAELQLLAKVHKLLLAEPAFDERARVHAGAGVALEINDIPGLLVGAAAEKVIEADFVKRRRRGIGGDVPADVGGLVGSHH